MKKHLTHGRYSVQKICPRKKTASLLNDLGFWEIWWKLNLRHLAAVGGKVTIAVIISIQRLLTGWVGTHWLGWWWRNIGVTYGTRIIAKIVHLVPKFNNFQIFVFYFLNKLLKIFLFLFWAWTVPYRVTWAWVCPIFSPSQILIFLLL